MPTITTPTRSPPRWYPNTQSPLSSPSNSEIASDSILKHNSDVQVTLIGDEVHHPYNRPPLSKEALASGSNLESIKLRVANKDGRLNLTLGRSVVSHSGSSRMITIDDGSSLAYDALVVATGISPRRLNIPRVDRGVFQLRTYDDMVKLTERIKRPHAIAFTYLPLCGCLHFATTTIRLPLQLIYTID